MEEIERLRQMVEVQGEIVRISQRNSELKDQCAAIKAGMKAVKRRRFPGVSKSSRFPADVPASYRAVFRISVRRLYHFIKSPKRLPV